MPLMSDMTWKALRDWLKDLGQRVESVRYAEALLAFAVIGAAILTILGSRWYIVAVLVLLGSIILLIFQHLARLEPASFRLPALMLLWGSMLGVIAALILSATVFFAHWPIQLANVVGLEQDPDPAETDFLERMTVSRIDYHECGETNLRYSKRLARACILNHLTDACVAIKNKHDFCVKNNQLVAVISEPRDEMKTTVAPAQPPPLQVASASAQDKCSKKNVSSLAAGAEVLGIDISHKDASLDWDALKKSGLYVFVFIKASEGERFQDSAFKSNWDRAGQYGFIRGAYHYFTNAKGDTQANNFLNVLSGVTLGPCDIGAALAMERPTAAIGNTKQYTQYALQWLDIVQSKVMVPPVLYTTTEFFINGLNAPPGFARFPTWLAKYSKVQPNPLPEHSRFDFWQYESRPVKGAPLAVDISRYNGTAGELIAMTR